MNFRIEVLSIANNNRTDLSEVVIDPKWFTSMNYQAGRLEFDIIQEKDAFLRSGDIIEAWVDGKKIFKGKVFSRSTRENGIWSITAYDNLRYLQNEDVLVFGASSITDRFKKICEVQGLPYKIGQRSPYNCKAAVYDGKTYFSILQEGLEETRVNANNSRYTIFDDVGTLRFVALEELNTNLLLGDNSLVTEYEYENSIDDTVNSVKVVKEDEKKKTRSIYSASDSNSIRKYGRLQKVESANDSKMNAQQLQKQANDLLKESNVESSTFSLTLVGTMQLRAGCSFNLELSALNKEWGKSRRVVLVKECTHTFFPVHNTTVKVELVY